MGNGRQSHKIGSLKNLTLLLVILCLTYGLILMSHHHGYSSKRIIIIVTDKELLSIDAIQVDHCYVCICLGAAPLETVMSGSTQYHALTHGSHS